jgi:nucleotide-binding universal stress UspA family protein
VDASRSIVVGVDGSDSSLRALSWAARQAELTGFLLQAVTVWSYPDQPTPFGIVPDLRQPGRAVSEARRRLEEVTAAERSHHHLGELRTDVVDGAPAAVLVEAARGAELLVVGSRGRGALMGMLLGSVSEHCVRYAPCPVVVVRSEDDAV